MKKLMIAALAAVATVCAAQASSSYGIGADGYVKPYALDTNPGDGHAGWYSCYVMKQGDAQKAMGTTDTVTYETMAAWLGENFVDNKASVINYAEQISYNSYAFGRQYFFAKDSSVGSDTTSAIGVFFYDDSKNVAYNVIPNTSVGGKFYVDDDMIPAGSGWVAVVPEPTSGLLLLLGVAGLALKRKRA